MSKLIDAFKKETVFGRIVTIATIIMAAVVVVVSCMGLIRIIPIEVSNSIAIPVLGIINLLNGIKMYRVNKKNALLYFFVAAFILVCTIFIFYFRWQINLFK